MPKKALPSPPPQKPASKPRRKAGRPPNAGAYVPTEQERQMVLRAAGLGMSRQEIANLMPSVVRTKDPSKSSMSINTLTMYFEHELEKGRAQANLNVANALYKNAVGGTETNPDGHVTAQIWWTKTRMGWRDPTYDRPLNEPPPQEAVIVDENSELEVARRIAFALALGHQKAKKTA